MRRMVAVIALAVFMASGIVSCTEQTTKAGYAAPVVVTTTGIIGDIVHQIAGDSVECISLMGPGVDPHYYIATQGDLGKLRKAELIVYNGLKLEGKMQDVLEQIGKDKFVVEMAAPLKRSNLRQTAGEGADAVYDPHIWFDVVLWSKATWHLSQEMGKWRPSAAEYFTQNATDYLRKLAALDSACRADIQLIPEGTRYLITSHDAFSYFAEAYGMTVKPLQGVSTVSEFGLKDVADMVDFIIENKPKAVFVESSVSPKSINSVIAGCEAKGHELKIGGELFSDALGEADSPEGTYLGMVQHNLETIVNAMK